MWGRGIEGLVVDIERWDPRVAIQALELVHANAGSISIFVIGTMKDPSVIVAAMRAGAREYLERDAAPESFADALKRFADLTSKARASSTRARILAVTNAKGGAGATTVAGNTALPPQHSHGRTVLVDFAFLGHAALPFKRPP